MGMLICFQCWMMESLRWTSCALVCFGLPSWNSRRRQGQRRDVKVPWFLFTVNPSVKQTNSANWRLTMRNRRQLNSFLTTMVPAVSSSRQTFPLAEACWCHGQSHSWPDWPAPGHRLRTVDTALPETWRAFSTPGRFDDDEWWVTIACPSNPKTPVYLKDVAVRRGPLTWSTWPLVTTKAKNQLRHGCPTTIGTFPLRIQCWKRKLTCCPGKLTFATPTRT